MLTFTRFPNDDFTVFISRGNTRVDEWLDTLMQYGAKGITKYELFDLRHHTYLFSSEEIERILNLTISNLSHRPPETKTALLVDKQAMYGISRVYDILMEIQGIEGLSTEVFNDIDSALEWLGRDLEHLVRKSSVSMEN